MRRRRFGRLRPRVTRVRRRSTCPRVQPAAHCEVPFHWAVGRKRPSWALERGRGDERGHGRRTAPQTPRAPASVRRGRLRDASCSRREARPRPGRKEPRTRSVRRTPRAPETRARRRPRSARRDARPTPPRRPYLAQRRARARGDRCRTVCAIRRASASSLSCADSMKPTENVLTGRAMFRAIRATMTLESRPPLSIAPRGTSLISLTRTESSSSARSWRPYSSVPSRLRSGDGLG